MDMNRETSGRYRILFFLYLDIDDKFEIKNIRNLQGQSGKTHSQSTTSS